jgi:fructose-1,6-bisphosphatase II
MFNPSSIYYMRKIVVGPEAAGVIDITAPTKVNLEKIAKAKGRELSSLTVMLLDRPRHDELVREIREVGARIKFITDGDVAGAVEAAREGTGIDVLMGIGGTPEGIIAACAMKCLGGEIQGILHPRNDVDKELIRSRGIEINQVLTTNDLVSGDDVFFAATGITDGELLRGIRFSSRHIKSNSLVMRSKSKTIRVLESEHPINS